MKKNKAFVIGGTGGLGAEVCRALAGRGFELAFTYNENRDKAESLAEELGAAAYLHLDLSDIDSVREAVRTANDKLGGFGVLVVCSGLATGHEREGEPFVPKFSEVTVDGYDRMMSVNVRGVFFACQEAAGIIAANGGGQIVIVSSIDGIKPVPSPADYACCKAALWGLTQSLSKELGRDNILVNMVAPGILEGGIADLLSKELMEEYVKHCSLKRVGKFSEIADVIAFLAGERNTYLTGQAVTLDGGL